MNYTFFPNRARIIKARHYIFFLSFTLHNTCCLKLTKAGTFSQTTPFPFFPSTIRHGSCQDSNLGTSSHDPDALTTRSKCPWSRPFYLILEKTCFNSSTLCNSLGYLTILNVDLENKMVTFLIINTDDWFKGIQTIITKLCYCLNELILYFVWIYFSFYLFYLVRYSFYCDFAKDCYLIFNLCVRLILDVFITLTTWQLIHFHLGCQILAQSGSDWQETGQIWDFSDQISVNFCSSNLQAKIFWNLIWKSPGFVQFRTNLTRFRPKFDILDFPGLDWKVDQASINRLLKTISAVFYR